MPSFDEIFQAALHDCSPIVPTMRLVSQSDVERLKQMSERWHKGGVQTNALPAGIDIALLELGIDEVPR